MNVENVIQLIEVLGKLLDLYKQELKLVENRVEAIKDNKLDDLNKIIVKEKELGDLIKKVELERSTLMSNYGEIRLVELIEHIEDQSYREKLLEVREELLNIIGNIKDKNDICHKLIDLSNEVVDTLFNELTGKKEVGYNKFKKKSTVANNNLFNTKV